MYDESGWTFGRTVERLLDARGSTVTEMCRTIKHPCRDTVYKWKYARHSDPKLSHVRSVANYLEMSIDQLSLEYEADVASHGGRKLKL